MKKAIIIIAIFATACSGGEKPFQPGEEITLNTSRIETLVYYWNAENQFYKVEIDESSGMEAECSFSLDLLDSTYTDYLLGDLDLRQCETGTTENNHFGIKPPNMNLLVEVTRSRVIHTRVEGTRKVVREYR